MCVSFRCMRVRDYFNTENRMTKQYSMCLRERTYQATDLLEPDLPKTSAPSQKARPVLMSVSDN